MTSCSGIMHEEMPQIRPEGIAGLQLWLNLPAREKMTRPKYRDLHADRLTETSLDGGAQVRVIAGEASGGRLTGPVEGLAVAPKFVDVTLPPGTTFRESVEHRRHKRPSLLGSPCPSKPHRDWSTDRSAPRIQRGQRPVNGFRSRKGPEETGPRGERTSLRCRELARA